MFVAGISGNVSDSGGVIAFVHGIRLG